MAILYKNSIFCKERFDLKSIFYKIFFAKQYNLL